MCPIDQRLPHEMAAKSRGFPSSYLKLGVPNKSENRHVWHFNYLTFDSNLKQIHTKGLFKHSKVEEVVSFIALSKTRPVHDKSLKYCISKFSQIRIVGKDLLFQLGNALSIEAICKLSRITIEESSDPITVFLLGAAIPCLGVSSGLRNMRIAFSLFSLASQIMDQGAHLRILKCSGVHEYTKINHENLKKRALLKLIEGVVQIIGEIPGMSFVCIPVAVACAVSAKNMEITCIPDLIINYEE